MIYYDVVAAAQRQQLTGYEMMRMNKYGIGSRTLNSVFQLLPCLIGLMSYHVTGRHHDNRLADIDSMIYNIELCLMDKLSY